MSDPSLDWYAPNQQCVGIDVEANVATGADAGTPGTWTPTGSEMPWDLAGMGGVVANPQTPWTSGERMVTGSGDLVTWSGTDWVGGPAPMATKAAATKATAKTTTEEAPAAP